ncbi:MAG: hypothetical protein LRY73_04635 [Bacillus sp. (in: Bacteria)]|nr:hypothetical protein [Bacillus sp. (in: firmicutes)]
MTIDQEPVYEMTSTFSVKPIEGTDAPENVVLLTIDDSFLSTNNTYAWIWLKYYMN